MAQRRARWFSKAQQSVCLCAWVEGWGGGGVLKGVLGPAHPSALRRCKGFPSLDAGGERNEVTEGKARVLRALTCVTLRTRAGMPTPFDATELEVMRARKRSPRARVSSRNPRMGSMPPLSTKACPSASWRDTSGSTTQVSSEVYCNRLHRASAHDSTVADGSFKTATSGRWNTLSRAGTRAPTQRSQSPGWCRISSSSEDPTEHAHATSFGNHPSEAGGESLRRTFLAARAP